MAADEIMIAKVERSKASDARVRLVEFSKRPFVDLRTFVDGNADERVPTRKGIAIPPVLVGEVIEALHQGEAGARERGLIEGCRTRPRSSRRCAAGTCGW